MSDSDKRHVLSDHKKIGKSYIPPLLQLGNIETISWLNSALPELIWLGLLNEKYGLKKGSELALALAEVSRKAANREGNPLYALISSYASLQPETWLEIVACLEDDGLTEIRDGLSVLVTLYPECPFSSLYEKPLVNIEIDEDKHRSLINGFKEFLQGFFPKYDKPATLAQANAVYIAFISEKLKVVEGVSALDKFPEVAQFPDTEVSKHVAASIYPMTNILVGINLDEPSPSSWAQYFWNRGFELERCSISKVVNSYD